MILYCIEEVAWLGGKTISDTHHKNEVSCRKQSWSLLFILESCIRDGAQNIIYGTCYSGRSSSGTSSSSCPASQRTDLSSLLNTASDGWVPPDGWKAAQSGQKELFDTMLQAVLTNAGLDDDELVRDKMTLRLI